MFALSVQEVWVLVRDYTLKMKKVESAATARNKRLALAGKKVLVQFTRPVEEGSVTGYVLAVGPQFFLLALVDDNVRFKRLSVLSIERCQESSGAR